MNKKALRVRQLRIVIGVIGLIAMILSPFVIGGPIAHANNSMPTSDSAAYAQMNNECAGGPYAVVAGYITGVNYNSSNNTGSYTLKVFWQRCNGSPNTNAFAVTGYSTLNGVNAVCPDAGWYGNGVDPTHDCVKYTKENNNTANEKYYEDRMNSTGLNYVERKEQQPSTSPSSTSYSVSATIPAHTAKTYVFNSSLCVWFKYQDSRGTWHNNGPDNHAGQCQDLSVTFTNPWNIATSTQADRTTSYPGDTITWTHTVTNSGPDVTGKDVTMNANRVNSAGQPVDANGNANTSGNGIYTWSKILPSGSAKDSAKSDSTKDKYVVQPGDVGRQICRNTAASPINVSYNYNDGGSWATDSPPSCVTILQRVYGSWGQYGISATGKIQNMASGGALSGFGLVGTLQTNTICLISQLTFGNTTSKVCTGTDLGAYANDSGLPNVLGRFVGNNGTYYTNGTNLSVTGSGVSLVSANMSIPKTGTATSTIPVGKWLVLDARGKTVTINGNIQYDNGTITDIKDIPQLIIMADTINISDNVTRVDAWLVANTLNTCGNVDPTQLSSAVCNKQLIVNGPVMTGHLYMDRTYYVSGDSAAEIFNLGGDAYLWSMAMASDGSITPVISTELPPRY